MHNKNINSIKMRAINLNLVLDAIRMHQSISRTDLAKVVGLTNATITNLISIAIKEEYVIESGVESSKGGRRPKVLELNRSAGYVVGIEINTEELIFVLTDFTAQIIDRKCVEINRDWKFERILAIIANTIDVLLENNRVEKKKVIGIGIAAPGPLDHKSGVIINPPNFPVWENIEVARLLENETGIPVMLEKETTSLALCESWLDVEKNYSNILAITIYRNGIGGGLYINGDLYHGYKDAGLEIGHMTVERNGTECRCGKSGCFEVMADGAAAMNYYFERTGKYIDFESLMHGADNGDENCIYAVEQCAVYIGEAISSLIAILAPDVIFIGGEFINRCKLLFEECVKRTEEHTYPYTDVEIEIKKPKLGKYSCAFGAVAKVLNKNIHA